MLSKNGLRNPGRVAHFSLPPNPESTPFLALFARSGTMKDVGGNELGSEDQPFGRGKDIIDQNPLLPKPGRSGAPSVCLPMGSGPARPQDWF